MVDIPIGSDCPPHHKGCYDDMGNLSSYLVINESDLARYFGVQHAYTGFCDLVEIVQKL